MTDRSSTSKGVKEPKRGAKSRTSDKPPNPKTENSKHPKRRSDRDGPPDDIQAFFGHPLTAATTAINGEDTTASAAALLHEYINLPAIDKSGVRLEGQNIETTEDIYDEGEERSQPGRKVESVVVLPANGSEGDYMELLHMHPEVEKFLNEEDEPEDSIKEPKVNSDDENTCDANIKMDISSECQDQDTKLSVITSDDIVIDTASSPKDELVTDMRRDISLSASPSSASSNHSSSPPTYHAAGVKSTDNVVSPCSYVQSVLAPGGEDLVFNSDTPTSVTQAINPINSADGKSVDVVGATESDTYGTSTDLSEPETRINGITKKISKALNEKILKKLNQQTMVHNINSCGVDVTTSGSMNHYSHSDIHMDTKAFPVKSEHDSLLNSYCQHLNGNMSAMDNDNAISIPALTSSLTSNSVSDQSVSAAMTSASLPCDTLSASLTMPVVNTTQPHEQPQQQQQQQTQYAYPSEVQPIHVVQNIHATYQTNISPPNSQHSITPVRQHSYPGYFGNSNGYMTYPYSETSPTDSQNPDGQIILERYIQQQQQQQYYQEHASHHHQYPYSMSGMKENTNYAMKSPDSGFHEPCSPTDNKNMQLKDGNSSFQETPNATSTQKVARRRKSATANYANKAGFWPGEKLNFSTVVPKIENDTTGYTYTLETPISTSVRIDEDRITYLNKGQYYGLTLEFNADRIPQCQLAKSVIMVVFRDDKSLEDERKAWEFWHSRQHSHKQRVLDIDTKDSQGVLPNSISEISYNAVSVKWNPKDSPVKVNIAVHCLSTDFSNQKGVKGFPLHLQIDTFENPKDTYPIHRGYCQIKVFCDKGAERKTRDEERRRNSRSKADVNATAGRKRQEQEVFHPVSERSEFYTMADSRTFPILFSPNLEHEESTKSSPLNGCLHDDDGNSSLNSTGDCMEDSLYPPMKRQRRDSFSSYLDYPKILLYVREQQETIFNALMLRMPTLQGLLMAIQEKYNIPASQVKSTYKRSKKGILVRMDDNIVRHYSHESTFMIEMNVINDDKDYEIILTEIDPN